MYTGDTLLDGVTGNVISSSSNDGPFIDPRYITRAEDDVVYIYQDFPEWEISLWDTLIWFGAAPGDRWDNLTYVDHSCECPYTVVDTGHVEVDGVWLRTIDVRG